MLGQTECDIARRMIEVKFYERQEQIRKEIGQIKVRMVNQGLSFSSGHYKEAEELCAHELSIRASIAWQTLKHVLSTAGLTPSDTLADDLKTEVQNYLIQERSEFQSKLEEWGSRGSMSSAVPLLKAQDIALKRVGAEIDLWMIELQIRAEAISSSPAEAQQPPISIGEVHGGFIFQTGPGATASVTIISSENREAILQAIERVKKEIEDAADLPGLNKEEIGEILEEISSEAQKDEPNGLRLGSLFAGAIAAISAFASLRPAYQTLKGAAALLGINLP